MIKPASTFLVFGMILLGGCMLSASPEITVNYYSLDYPPPALNGYEPQNVTVRIPRFTSAQECNLQNMIFSPRPGMLQLFNYSRWLVYPADLCTDYLLRDMRAAGVLKVVQNLNADFRLEGAVSRFWRMDRDGGAAVNLTINCTLLNNDEKAHADWKILFQRTYVQEEEAADNSPLTLALAMSRAFGRFSLQVQRDIYDALAAWRQDKLSAEQN
jgi:ABC-type uncharacterized transport system auxiliary subunit